MKTLTLTNDARPIIFLLLLASLAAAQPSPPENSPPPPTAYGFNTRFNPSMAIIIAVLITAFFFMGFFSVYLRQCAGDSASVRAGSQVGSRGRSRRAARGLDPSVIGTFPTFEYSEVKNLKIGKGTLECAVCLNEFEDDETLRLLPKCSHVFHPECIDAWLVKRTTCPVCRANLLPGPDPEPAAAQTAEAVLDPENPAHSDDHREANENEVAITIEEDRPAAAAAAAAVPTVPNLFNPIQNRPPRSKSSRRPGISGKFPRSHSTGHSLVQPCENIDRFTLRLPEHIRRDLVNGPLNRTTSCRFPSEGLVFDGSVRRGYRIGGEGSSRGRNGGEGSSRGRSFGLFDRSGKSDGWVFSMAPPFITRSFSVRSPSKKGTAVKTPFDCLGGAKAGADSEEFPAPQRSPTPVFTVAPPQ